MTDPQNWQSPTSGQPWGENAPAPGTPASGGYVPPAGSPLPPPYPSGPTGWAPPPKPGLVPLRPLGFGTLLGAPFQVLKRNPKATFGSALIVQAVIALITLLVVGTVTALALGRIDNASLAEQDAVEAGSIAAIILSALIPIALSLVGSALLQGVIVTEVARATLGEKLRLGPLWRAAGRRLWPLVLWTLLLSAALLIGIGLLAGAIALLLTLGPAGVALAVVVGIFGGLGLLACAVWLYTRTSLVPSLIVLERLSIGRAIKRSWSLTLGYFWRTFGVQALVATIVNVVAQVITTPLSLVFSLMTSVVDPNAAFDAFLPALFLYVLLLFVSLVLGAVAAVVQSAVTALIYIDLRMRKEGLDLELQRFVEAASAARQSGVALADPYLPHADRPASPPTSGAHWA